jgi:hypothetical protein
MIGLVDGYCEISVKILGGKQSTVGHTLVQPFTELCVGGD